MASGGEPKPVAVKAGEKSQRASKVVTELGSSDSGSDSILKAPLTASLGRNIGRGLHGCLCHSCGRPLLPTLIGLDLFVKAGKELGICSAISSTCSSLQR